MSLLNVRAAAAAPELQPRSPATTSTSTSTSTRVCRLTQRGLLTRPTAQLPYFRPMSNHHAAPRYTSCCARVSLPDSLPRLR